jgi:hypothetical protein
VRAQCDRADPVDHGRLSRLHLAPQRNVQIVL